MSFPRRRFLELSATSLWAVSALLSRPGVTLAQAQTPATDAVPTVSPTYPAHDPDMARDMVGASHGNVARVRESLGDAGQAYVNEALPEGAAELFVGVYSFGPGPGDRFDVGTNKSGALGIKRLPGGSFRNLFHQGANAFHPPGNPIVRITFDFTSGPAEQLSIVEGAKTITARRIQL